MSEAQPDADNAMTMAMLANVLRERYFDIGTTFVVNEAQTEEGRGAGVDPQNSVLDTSAII